MNATTTYTLTESEVTGTSRIADAFSSYGYTGRESYFAAAARSYAESAVNHWYGDQRRGHLTHGFSKTSARSTALLEAVVARIAAAVA